MTDRNTFWSSAGIAGLVLGGVSILYMLCTMLTGMVGSESRMVGLLVGLANAALWAAKLIVCVRLMKHFMQSFSKADPDADNGRVFRFGSLTALLSAMVYSAFYLAYMKFIAPESFQEAFDLMMDNPMMTGESLEMMESIIPMMPTYTFFFNLIYCWLFGTVVAAIFSKDIPSRNPFDE